LKPIPAFYSFAQPFPPKYFRQEIPLWSVLSPYQARLDEMVGFNTKHRRKIVVIPALEPTSARFILPGAVFYRDGQTGNRTIGPLK